VPPGSYITTSTLLQSCRFYPPPLLRLPQSVRDALVSERDRLFLQLQQVPYLEPYPSHANFVLCKVRPPARPPATRLPACLLACRLR
jgi:histidinol-phosphate/aromatic aminotransferase/cobyric acid decarboxylase-like protein